MKKFVDTSNVIGAIAGIAGIIIFYIFSHNWIYWFACISLISSIINVNFGGQHSLTTEVIAACAGLFYALVFQCEILKYIALALCFESAAVSLFALVFTFPWLVAKVGLIFSHKDKVNK